MESFFSRYRNVLVLITVLLAQVIGLAVQVRRPGQRPEDKGGVLLIRAWVTGVVTPPERLLHGIGMGVRGTWMNYLDLIHVRQQNQDLQAELGRLRLEEASLAEDAKQGQRLQALMGFQEKYVYKTVAAQVIGTSGTEQSKVLLIDKGLRDGIRPDMPVITPDGIVGKTRDVFAHSSQVLEVSDPTSGAGVIMQNTRIRGVLRGNSWGQPEIVDVSPDERIKPGEPVVTSGGDAIFPRGLAVGTVERVMPQPDGTLVNVLIRPAANLSKLEEVLVITSTGSQMPQQMQQDLSDAQQRAADILADRLPSRIDPNAPPSEQSDGNDDVGPDGEVTRPMKPPPALHADRYTPSDTPPAEDLTPGKPITNIETAQAPDQSAKSRTTATDGGTRKRTEAPTAGGPEGARAVNRSATEAGEPETRNPAGRSAGESSRPQTPGPAGPAKTSPAGEAEPQPARQPAPAAPAPAQSTPPQGAA